MWLDRERKHYPDTGTSFPNPSASSGNIHPGTNRENKELNPRDSIPQLSFDGILHIVNDWWEFAWDQQMGKPRSGRTEPIFSETPISQLIGALIRLFGGAAITAIVFAALFDPTFWTLSVTFKSIALPVMAGSTIAGWILTTGGARKLLTMIVHSCAHGTFSVERQTGETGSDVNARLADWLTALLGLQSWAIFKLEHCCKHHEPGILATLSDPDAHTTVRLLGLKPGLAEGDYRYRVLRALFSVRVHWQFLKARFRFIFIPAAMPSELPPELPRRVRLQVAALFADPTIHRRRRNLGVSLQAGIFGTFLLASVLVHTWIPFGIFLLSWVFPLTILYTQSAILQFVTEHGWLVVRNPSEPYKAYLQRIVHNRFVGSPWPRVTGSFPKMVWAHLRWWTRLLLLEIPVRHFVLVGSICVHGSHHRNQGETDWANEFYVAQRRLEAGEAMLQYWSLTEAFSSISRALSQLPPLREATDESTEAVFDQAIQGM
jgi:hypothetical protein